MELGKFDFFQWIIQVEAEQRNQQKDEELVANEMDEDLGRKTEKKKIEILKKRIKKINKRNKLIKKMNENIREMIESQLEDEELERELEELNAEEFDKEFEKKERTEEEFQREVQEMWVFFHRNNMFPSITNEMFK